MHFNIYATPEIFAAVNYFGDIFFTVLTVLHFVFSRPPVFLVNVKKLLRTVKKNRYQTGYAVNEQ